MNCITDVIKILKDAERMGSEEDKPEGSRYIQISDTLAKIMEETLQGIYE